MNDTQYFFQMDGNFIVGPMSLRGFQNLRIEAAQDKKRKRLEAKCWLEKLEEYWRKRNEAN